MPARLRLEWLELDGWPRWGKILAELGPAGPSEGPWWDLTGWDVTRDFIVDARLWLELLDRRVRARGAGLTEPPSGAPVLAVTLKLASAVLRAARGPAEEQLAEALLTGIGAGCPP